MANAKHTEIFNCSVPEFFRVVADYEKYPEFLQEVKSCKILKTEGSRKLVEYQVSVIKTFSYKLWMTESPPASINWEFAGGDIFKTSNGSWYLHEHDGGKTLAQYEVDATFNVFVPGMIAKTLLNVNLPTMMKAYHERIKELYGK